MTTSVSRRFDFSDRGMLVADSEEGGAKSFTLYPWHRIKSVRYFETRDGETSLQISVFQPGNEDELFNITSQNSSGQPLKEVFMLIGRFTSPQA